MCVCVCVCIHLCVRGGYLVEAEGAAVQSVAILVSQDEVYEPRWLSVVSQVPALWTAELQHNT